MIKRTITISSPSHLSVMRGQLMIHNKPRDETTTLPLEDIGFLLLENDQITLTLPLLQRCIEENIAVIICDQCHLPAGSLIPLEGHGLTGKRVRAQTEVSKPLKKQLWRQIIVAKISNQATVVHEVNPACADALLALSREVQSGDPTNREGAAARLYWSALFTPDFTREREGPFPNDLLNYGYAILRAATARAIVGSGLSPELGLFHHNQYNALALADDVMEPYRPFVDRIVMDLVSKGSTSLGKEERRHLVCVVGEEVKINGLARPIQLALSMTSASLAACFEGKSKALLLPSFVT